MLPQRKRSHPRINRPRKRRSRCLGQETWPRAHSSNRLRIIPLVHASLRCRNTLRIDWKRSGQTTKKTAAEAVCFDWTRVHKYHQGVDMCRKCFWKRINIGLAFFLLFFLRVFMNYRSILNETHAAYRLLKERLPSEDLSHTLYNTI